MKRLTLYITLLFGTLFFTVPIHATETFSVEYFNNINLSGSPVYTDSESTISHDWVAGSPDPSVQVDYFSARWTGNPHFEAGTYTFYATSDDGVKVIIDGQTMINQWVDQGPTQQKTTVDFLEGNHQIVIEYYERTGGATMFFSWERQNTTVHQTRIMPLGDSLTDGYNVPGAYRPELKKRVQDIDFVGSSQNGPNELNDRDHEGHPGWRIDEIHNFIGPWLQSSNPEMVLLLIGTNDLLQQRDVVNAPARLNALIDTIIQTKPNADIFVGTILPLSDSKYTQQVASYNNALIDIVQNKRGTGKKVHLVDLFSAVTTADLNDGIHPNAEGHARVAQKWADAIATVRAGGSTTIPTTEPTPTPTPVIETGTGQYKAEYFNNMTLSGSPILSRQEEDIQYNWGANSPHPSVNKDYFSTRWTTTTTFDAATYRFSVTGDDGIRLKVDGSTKIDQWKDQGPTTYTIDVPMTAGEHTIVLEYYEKAGGATAKLSFTKQEETPTPTATPTPTPTTAPTQTKPPNPGEGYVAEYFNNRTLSGSPVLTRNELTINNTWGLGSPAPSVSNDNFSARWTTVEPFAASVYKFTMTGDDGVRLKIDGQTVIDKWKDQSATTYTAYVDMTAGDHTIVMEYYENGWDATAKLSIEEVATPTIPSPSTKDEFTIQYFNNKSLSGSPAYTTTSPLVDFNWGLGSPHSSVQSDNFSARATKTSQYTAGTYRFTLTGDDGIRLIIDGHTVIDKWKDQSATSYSVDTTLSAGNHTITIEYYENGWDAVLKHTALKL